MKTGTANLPLHGGNAPAWLFTRMTKLSREIISLMVMEFGTVRVLEKLSDPYWFQSLGCVLGFDWHSSGVTTTVCGAIKEGLKGMESELGFYTAGGKGKVSRRTPDEILLHADKHSLNVDAPGLVYASKMSAKVDSTAVQDGYQLYHHVFFFDSAGNWAVDSVSFYGSRYGDPNQVPKDEFSIYICNKDFNIIKEIKEPYTKLDIEKERWHQFDFEPVKVSDGFYVCVYFAPTQYKGFYMHYDTNVKKSHSKKALPLTFVSDIKKDKQFDWMIRTHLRKAD
jgi:hypothetical protein